MAGARRASTTNAALARLGGDLPFMISFSVGNELKTSALELGLHLDELITLAFVLYVMVSALRSSLSSLEEQIGNILHAVWNRRRFTGRAAPQPSVTDDTRSPFKFVEGVLDMAERITLQLAVQLVASSVNMTQSIRTVRILSLLSVSIFFMFIQEGATLSRGPTS
tara:strand:- start:384 stop:881 length:498 start_codon:yes stop_codon:yes gene_type:complete